MRQSVFTIDGAGSAQSRMHMGEGLAGARRKKCPPGTRKVGIRCSTTGGGHKRKRGGGGGGGVYRDKNGRCHKANGRFTKCR